MYVCMQAGETVFILKEKAAELTSADRDLEMGNFYSNMDQLSLYLTRLRVYFENIADDLSESTLNVLLRQIQFLRELHFPWVRIGVCSALSSGKAFARCPEGPEFDSKQHFFSSLLFFSFLLFSFSFHVVFILGKTVLLCFCIQLTIVD